MLSVRCLSVLSVCPSCLPVCNVGVLWPNGWSDPDETWHACIGLGPGHTVLHGDQAPLPQRDRAPQFSAHNCCGQMARWIKMPHGREVGLGLRDIVLDGDPAPPPLKVHSPQFSANVCCGQTAECTKMPLGMEVGLGPGDFVFDGDPGTPEKRAYPSHPIFGPCLLWPNRWMDQDASWYADKPRPRRRCLRLICVAAPPNGGTAPSFRFMSIVAKRMDQRRRHPYGSRPRRRPHCISAVPALREWGTAAPPLFLAHVYCGHGRPSQLLLSSCCTYHRVSSGMLLCMGRSGPPSITWFF